MPQIVNKNVAVIYSAINLHGNDVLLLASQKDNDAAMNDADGDINDDNVGDVRDAEDVDGEDANYVVQFADDDYVDLNGSNENDN